MPKLGSYEYLEIIKKNESRTIYRVVDARGDAYVLKLLHHLGYAHGDGVKIRREFKMGALFNAPNILKVVQQGTIEGAPFITYEDFHGTSLKARIANKPLEMKLFFEVASKMVLALIECHAKGIVHRDINPSNFIVSDDFTIVKLADFGLADYAKSFLEGDMTQGYLQGTLEYIAPEQTGRLSARVDFRTDIYSLGITFYEMLTGTVPFENASGDAFELVRRHLSEPIQPLTRLNPLVPRTLSDLVEKMVSKNPDQRYQSAFGLKEDLTRLKLMVEREHYQFFEVGLRDVSPIFKASNDLFSRRDLFEALMPTVSGKLSEKSRHTLVKGEATSGKTFMLKAIANQYRQLGAEVLWVGCQRSFFSRPYAALEVAINGWIEGVENGHEEDLTRVVKALISNIGPSLGLLTKTFPALEKLVGDWASVESMNPQENRTRFNQGMLELLQIIRGDAPVMLLCIDDFHLLDPAALQLITYIFTSNLQLTDLVLAMDSQSESPEVLAVLGQVPMSQYALDPFGHEDIEAFLRAGFQLDLGTSQALTELMGAKTNGNPGALVSVVNRAVEDRILEFDYLTGRWHFDASRQEAIGLSAHGIKSFERVFDSLDGGQRQFLELLALTEGPVAVTSLVQLDNHEPMLLFDWIQQLIEQGVLKSNQRILDVMMLGDHPLEKHATSLPLQTFISFKNEDARAVVMGRMSQEAIADIHRRWGLMLFREWETCQGVFNKEANLRHHLNSCEMSLLASEVRIALSRLNLKAAQIAKSSIAYFKALEEANLALSAFPDSEAKSQGQLLNDILLLIAEMEYLNHNFEASERSFERLLLQVEDSDVLVRINILKLQLYINRGETIKVVTLAKDTLKLLEFDLKEDVPIARILANLAALQFSPYLSEPSKIAGIKRGENQRAMLILEVLNLLISVSYLLSKLLFIRIILAMIELSRKHGMMRLTPFAFATYGIVEIGLFKRYYKAWAIGEASLEAAVRGGDRETLSKVYFTIGFFISHWVKHVRDAIPYLELGKEQSRLSGNIVYYAYNSAGLVLARVAMSDNLMDIYEDAKKDLSHPDVQTDKDVSNLLVAVREYASAQMGLDAKLNFDLSQFERELRASNMPSILAHHLILKMKRYYIAGDYNVVIALSEEVQPLLGELMGLYISAEHVYYTALAFLKRRTQQAKMAIEGRLSHTNYNKLKGSLKRFKKVNSINFAHKCDHVVALEHWVAGRPVHAHTAFHEAIRKAHEQGFLLEEALICEDLSGFYHESGQNRLSDVFMREAYILYRQISSLDKCRLIRSKYTHIAFEQLEKAIFEPKVTRSLSAQTRQDYEIQLIARVTQSLGQVADESALLSNFLRLMLEVTGAQKGVLALQGDNLEVVAQMSQGEFWHVSPPETVQQTKRLPVLLVQYATRSKQETVTANAFEDYSFNRDPYVRLHRVKSALCVPIWTSERFMGIVYLENNMLKNAFELLNAQLLHILVAQFAMRYDNIALNQGLMLSKRALIRHEQNLSELVRERTYELSRTKQEIEILLNEVGQGFLSINSQGLINSQYSSECIKIFGHDIAHEPFFRLLESHVADFDSYFIREVIDKVFASEVDYQADVYLSLLPEVLKINGRMIKLKYQFVNRQLLKQITVTMQDITDRVLLEEEFNTERQQLRMVLNAVRYQGNVRQSIADFERFCESEARVLLMAADPRERLMTLFRLTHTFKGDFAQWSMIETMEALHRLESQLSNLYLAVSRQETIQVSELDGMLNVWLDQLDAKEILGPDLRIIEKYLGEDYMTKAVALTISKASIDDLRRVLAIQLPEAYGEVLEKSFYELSFVSIEHVMLQYSQYVQFLAESMGKSVAAIQVTGDQVRVDEVKFNPLFKSLIHVFRNAVQYGIEMPFEREALGKGPEGQISVHIEKKGGTVTINIEDDGQGLDLERILDRAREIYPDVASWSRDQQLQCVFDFGFTTRADVDEISGRGVGLSALKTAIQSIMGRVEVQSEPGAFTRFVMNFEV